MIIIVVVGVVVGIWLIRVRELGGLTDASQCRAIAKNGLDVTVICQHPVYTGCASPATTNAVTNRILLRKSDSCVYTRTSQIPHKFICSSRFTPRILHCHSMSYSSWDQPRVPAAPALPPTAEEEDEEDAAAMTGAQSDDSDSSAYSVEWERME